MDEYAACEAAYFNGFDNGFEAGKEAAKEEIVHCRDCEFDDRIECPLCYIERHCMIFINHDPDFYCAKAERKKEVMDG